MHNQSTTPTISVIVPVYNAEKYLHRCIDSILAQTYTDFELLLIDDGSKDKSGEICDEYARKDTRVRVFHQENGGVSSARNLGLDNAKGEWITFVDSDDYIEENFLKSFEGNLDADLVIGNMVEPRGRGDIIKTLPCGYYSSIRSALKGQLQCLGLQAPWGKLFRNASLGNLRFDERMRVSEDTQFVYVYMSKAKDVCILSPERRVGSSCYVYGGCENFDAKYQIPVKSAVYHMIALESAYQTLNMYDIDFEKFLPQAFFERCVNDMPMHGELWYNNKEVERICLRRSAHLGFIPWIKTWLSFHVFYRLKIRLAKKHAYLRV